jgi:hypothetical protein
LILIEIRQSFVMGYDFREFCSESKVFKSPFVPVLDHEFIGNSVEGRVNFNVIKDPRIVPQPLRIFKIFGIKRSLPGTITPTRTSDIVFQIPR